MDETVTNNKSKSLTALVITLSMVIILILLISKQMEQVRIFIRDRGWIGVVASVAIYGLLGASPVPSEPFTVFVSTIYGPLPATFIASFGNLIAALMEAFVGFKLGDIVSFEKQKEKLPFGLGKFPVNSPIFLIFARMLPGYGPKFVSVISGMYRVPIWRYIWTTILSNFIGAGIVAYGGFGLLKLDLF